MTTTTIAEFRALTSSTILIKWSFVLKVMIVWMCLFPTIVGRIPRDPTSSGLFAIQKRIAAATHNVAIFSPSKKDEQFHRLVVAVHHQPGASLAALSLLLPCSDLETFAPFDHLSFYKNKTSTLPVAIALPRIEKDEYIYYKKKKDEPTVSIEEVEEYRNATAMMLFGHDDDSVLVPSFLASVSYDDHQQDADRLMSSSSSSSSWIAYVAGCEEKEKSNGLLLLLVLALVSFVRRGGGDLLLVAGELVSFELIHSFQDFLYCHHDADNSRLFFSLFLPADCCVVGPILCHGCKNFKPTSL
jgi:hypothetical protein